MPGFELAVKGKHSNCLSSLSRAGCAHMLLKCVGPILRKFSKYLEMNKIDNSIAFKWLREQAMNLKSGKETALFMRGAEQH